MADLTHISRLVEQGKVPEARSALATQPRHDAEANRLRAVVRNLILRKCQRQAKVAEFLAEAGTDVRLRIAGARLGGTLPQLAVASPPESREALLASLALSAPGAPGTPGPSGDLRAGLARLRRAPGCAELAQGWTAVLRGDLEQATASFASVPAAEGRRAACGRAVVAALSGHAPEVEQHLAGLGPFPHTAFPAIAGMLQQVTRQRNEHSPAKLGELLRCTISAPVQRAYDGWPKAQAESKAWLALHLGDVRWAEAAAKGDQRAVALWHEAARLHPSTQADVLKRLLLAFVTLHDPVPGTWLLHKTLHQRDATLAQQVVDTVTADWPAPWCLQQLDMMYDEMGEAKPENAPVELLLLRFRGLTALPEWGQGRAAPDMKKLRPMLVSCDAVYSKNRTWLELKIGILGQAKLYTEQRKACFAALMVDPSWAAEILPRYLATARRDSRAKRQIADELTRLSSVLGDDVDLAAFSVEMNTLSPVEVHARWPGPLAAAILLVADRGKASELPALGHDEALDMLACMASGRLKPAQITQLLKDRDRLHRLLRRHQRRLALRYAMDEVFAQWKKRHSRDWRPWFHIGAFARCRDDSQATVMAWKRAIARTPREVPEHAEMAIWLEKNEDFGYFGSAGGADLYADGNDEDDNDFAVSNVDGIDDSDELEQMMFAEFEKKLEALYRKSMRAGKTAPAGKPPRLNLGKLPKSSKPISKKDVNFPLILSSSDRIDFCDAYGADTAKRIETLILSLGIPTTTDAEGLADSIAPSDRAAARDWLRMLAWHNNKMHDLSTASAIAVMIVRLTSVLPQ